MAIIGVQVRRIGDLAADIAAGPTEQRLRMDLADYRAGSRGCCPLAQRLDPLRHEVDGRAGEQVAARNARHLVDHLVGLPRTRATGQHFNFHFIPRIARRAVWTAVVTYSTAGASNRVRRMLKLVRSSVFS